MDYTPALRSLMKRADIPSFRALAQQANVSSWQIRQLRDGKAAQMRLEALLRISSALEVSLSALVNQCSANTVTEGAQAKLPRDTLRAEYERLQDQMNQQQGDLKESFQRTSLQTLESWMTYWPAAVYAAQSNPDLPATRLIPLVRPVEQLLAQWGVEAIAAVGDEVAYAPQEHQLIAGQADPGDPVRVSNPGYRHGGALIHRVKVKPI